MGRPYDERDPRGARAERVTVRLSAKQMEAIEYLCDAERIRVSEWVRRAVAEALERAGQQVGAKDSPA
jgi:hypothetical protein